MYDIVKFSIPFLAKYSSVAALLLFLWWLIQIKSKKYIHHLELKAKRKDIKSKIQLEIYNQANPNHQLEKTSGWYNRYKSYLRHRYTTLFLALISAYISFNTSSYYESSNDNFYKLLGISTTLFLAGLTYIQKNISE